MFSDRYSVREKYNLITQEHISTCEQMPVRFTSLQDDRYGPPLSSHAKENINRYISYKPKHVTDPLPDYDNDLFIEYKDGQILSHFAKKFMRYVVVTQSESLWQGFLSKINCHSINDCRTKIEKICSLTNYGETIINGIEYDSEGCFSGIRIFDTKFDLSDYSNTDFLEKIDKLTVRTDGGEYLATSSATIYPDRDIIKYNLNFMYYSFMSNSYMGKSGVARTKNMYPEQVDMYLDAIGVDGLQIITQEQSDFIKSLCVGDSYFNLTFVVNNSGECENIFVYHHTVDLFKDLTAS